MATFFSRPTSGAVKIVAPSREDGSPAPQPTQDQSRPPNVNAPVFVPKGAVSPDLSRAAPTPTPSHYVSSVAYDPYEIPNAESFYTPHQPTFVRQPLNYHLYAPASHLVTLMKSDQPQITFFMSDSLRQELTQRAEATHATSSNPSLNLPDELQGYHSLVSLDQPSFSSGKERRPNFGAWHSSVYKATSSIDGHACVLRRIENFRLSHEAAFAVIEQWTRIRHPNVVSVREAFTTRAFDDNSLIVSYDYHPNSTTLFDAYLKIPQRSHMSGPSSYTAGTSPIPEPVMWSYIIQIANAIRTVHEQGLAVRMIDPTKILITGKNRIRIGSCGIADVVAFDAREEIHFLQQEDLVQFGRLVCALCCNNLVAANNPNKSLEIISRNYSPDLKSVAQILLLQKQGSQKMLGHLFEMIGSRLLIEMECLQNNVDRLEGELMSELENGRLVRLLCKFGFINERPEFDREPRWSETGDRYIIKLFRDYVFHQVDENGNPVVNLSHVLTCLNKLDAGTEERVMLVSRDEQNCLVVSYKELKACVELAFNDLARGTS